ncbi:MAG TPA: SRPBCC domain-containing protein [bacterium]|nr:SRPBCC domain-containing protein [bacterium]
MTIELGNFEGKTHSKDLRFTRVFKAPRQKVFEAFTKREHLVHWWAPKPFTMPRCEVDLRPGGKWNYLFRSQEGVEHDCQAIYREVEPPSKFVMESSVPDSQGKPLFTIRQTILLEDKGAETGLVLEVKVLLVNPGGEPFLEGAKQGFGMTLTNLDEYLGRIGEETA